MNKTTLSCYLQFFSVALVHFSSEIKFSKLLVQPPHHLVTCAHHEISFSFFWTGYNCL